MGLEIPESIHDTPLTPYRRPVGRPHGSAAGRRADMMPLHDPQFARRLDRERRRAAERPRRIREAETGADGDRAHRQVRRPR
jgi:hypothetical protein